MEVVAVSDGGLRGGIFLFKLRDTEDEFDKGKDTECAGETAKLWSEGPVNVKENQWWLRDHEKYGNKERKL